MKYLLPPILSRLLTVPGLRKFFAWRTPKALQIERIRQLIPDDMEPAVEALFLHDLIGNVDLDGDGKPDAFRLAINNCWFHQQVTSVKVRLDGRQIKPAKLQIDNGYVTTTADKIRAIRFEPGVPFVITAIKKTLGNGLHLIDLEITGTVAPLFALSVPIDIKDNIGRLIVVADPPDPTLTIPPTDSRQRTVHFVPHIHYDFEWLRDHRTFARMAVKNLLEAIRILEQNPDATFIVDQVPQMEALQQAEPAAFKRLAELTKTGRVESMMGAYDEPDTNLVNGESLVRQAIFWQRFSKQHFDRYSEVAWWPDSFGFPATLPQILRKAGCRAFAFSRGVQDRESPSAFMWEGLDGTRIKTHWMHRMYFAGYPLPEDVKRSNYKLDRVVRKLAEKAPTDQLFCAAGIDHGRPQATAAEALRQFNQSQKYTKFHFSLPAKFFAALPDRGLPVLKTEFNPELQGTYAARPIIKQLHRQAETAVANLERVALIVDPAGRQYPHEILRGAWRKLMQCQSHDSITGCHTDEVCEEVKYRLRQVIALCCEETANLLGQLAARMMTTASEKQQSYLLVNTLPCWRRENVALEMTAQGGSMPKVTDGKSILPSQIISQDHYADGTSKQATVLAAVAVPPMGCRLIWTVPNGGDLPAEEIASVNVEKNVLRNAWLEVTLDPAKGTISHIHDRKRNFDLHLKNAGQITLGKDDGTLYLPQPRPLSRCKRFVPRRMEILEKGPLRAAVRFEGKIAKNDVSVTYRLHHAAKRIEVETQVDLKTPYRSLEVRVPLVGAHPTAVYEVPYGEMVRDNKEYAAQNYVDLPGDNFGLALLNTGTPSHRIEKKALVMRLVRSVDRIHFHDAGPGALSLGKQTYHYALLPHAGDSRQAHIFRWGKVFNTPIIVHRIAANDKNEPGETPPENLLKIAPDSIELGALYRDEEGTVVRLVERGGKDTMARLTANWDYSHAEITDLLGNVIREIKPTKRGKEKGSLYLTMRAWEIKTIRFT